MFVKINTLLVTLLILFSCSKSTQETEKVSSGSVDEEAVIVETTKKVSVKETRPTLSQAVVPVPLPSWLVDVTAAKYASLDKLAAGSEKGQKMQKAAVTKNLPLEVTLKKSGIPFRLIPNGTFMMGSKKGYAVEKKVHSVTLSQNFYCGKFELTQGNWLKVMDSLPERYTINELTRGENLPMVEVSWDQCQDFLRRLEKLEGMPVKSLNFLSEAQWEYACRAGTKTEFYFGNVVTSDHINLKGTEPYEGCPVSLYRNKPMPVGSFLPNAFGLYDMHGNVAEWCLDLCYKSTKHVKTYQKGIIDPLSRKGTDRVVRGGGFREGGKFVRSARRTGNDPTLFYRSTGTRIAISIVSFK